MPSPAPDEAARPATPADLDEIEALAAAFRTELELQRGGPLWAAHDALAAPDTRSLTSRLDDPSRVTVVGTLDGVVLAYGLGHLETLTDGRALAVVDELFVAEPARAVGLGECVLAHLVAWSRAAGAFGIDATALPGDRQAKNFFESAGFTARRLVMHHRLD